MRGFRKYLPAIASGMALIPAFAPIDIYQITWIALVPFLISLFGMKPRLAMKAGIFMGIPYFFGTQYWIYHSINHYGGVALIPSLLLVFVLALYMSLYTGMFAVLFSFKLGQSRLPAMLMAPLIWVCLEYLRAYALTGFPWSSIGYTQYKFLHLIQFADITGVYGVSFLVVAVNGALADIFIWGRKKSRMPLLSPSPMVAGYIALVLVFVAALGYGSMRLNEERPGEVFKASIIQGNINQAEKWDMQRQKYIIETYKGLTTSANAEHRPGLIVWPEAAVPFYFGTDASLTEELIEFQKGLDTYLLFGAVRVSDIVRDEVRFSNSALLLDRDGKVRYIYDKMHLVPFGEYVPIKKALFFVDKFAVGIGDYFPGKEHIKAETPFGKFGTPICYEIIFPGLVRKFYQKDGDFIVTITNDAWFGKTSGPYQHFGMVIFRAIENRKPLIRAANTGISGFIDSSGRVIKKTSLFERQTLTGDVRTDTTRSFYSRYGDLFSYLAIVLCLLIFLA